MCIKLKLKRPWFRFGPAHTPEMYSKPKLSDCTFPLLSLSQNAWLKIYPSLFLQGRSETFIGWVGCCFLPLFAILLSCRSDKPSVFFAGWLWWQKSRWCTTSSPSRWSTDWRSTSWRWTTSWTKTRWTWLRPWRSGPRSLSAPALLDPSHVPGQGREVWLSWR